ncbi:Polyphosphoinositide phosphatase [Lecanosticta acicola]|uniref:Polyphosphoinositide phosphatase n=1 Tax=Lecanosticta acicola TaxID=111012 RepID=A0AAI8YXW7_9PEZI|nr:Polyphosphoinositide phosphatase [Lecanosticta acicola]
MDFGDVDAAPNTSGDGPRAYSPQEERGEPSKRPGFRTDSTRQASKGDTDVHVQSGSHVGNPPSEAGESYHDPPTFPRVGATAEELAGKQCVETDEHMKEDPDTSFQVTDKESKPHRMHKFTLYETNTRYWITGADITDKYFRLLRIDRNSPPGQIVLFEDETVYDRKQMNDVLNTIDQGNKVTNGLRMKYSFWGILGFIRFTEAHYMLLITKRRQAAMIGGHYVYQIEGTELVPLTTGASSSFLRDRNAEEGRFLSILNNLDLTKSFYYSYSYDITHSLQRNVIRQRNALNEGRTAAAHEYNGMFVWNHHLLKPAVDALKHPYDWCFPIIHGFLDQAALDVFGRTIYVTIIGRRSRFFAGARFLKRGVNDSGYVANDVETEQIVADKLTTSLHAPGPRLYANPTYTSYVHHRGSIPLYWTQDNSGVTPKPGIDINLSDPFYSPAALHFDNLFERYGCPIYILNLIKAREKVPRESKLLSEYQDCINYLNQSLPEDSKILYRAYDMARAAKTRNSDVIGGLEVIARDILARTGFFHTGEQGYEEPQVQNGIARTNCIDCLDRTNAAQFVIGKHAFAQQLKVLGVINTDEVAYDTDAINLFTAMFHDHGDNIAMQYGGSHLVNTMTTYRKLSHWHSSSRDMVESFKRYYHNSFLDSQRQEAYNLFLGNYIWAQGQPMLWDLPTDYYLHHSDPKAWLERNRRNYIYWYTPEFLQRRVIPPRLARDLDELTSEGVCAFDDYWKECYRPAALSSLQKVYSYRMTSTQRYYPDRPYGDNKWDFSPFVRRADPHRHLESPEKTKPPRKGVKIVDPQDPPAEGTQRPEREPRPMTAGEDKPSILRETVYGRLPPQTHGASRPPSASSQKTFRPADKAQMHLWTLNQFHTQSLNPHVSDDEASEYARYITHPQNLPLVTSSELPSDANIDYIEYVNKAGGSNFEDFDSEEASTFGGGVGEADLQDYWDFVEEKVDPLTVTEEDGGKKRYKAYRQWLRGKSLFKQSKVDPEFTAEGV